MFKVQRKVSNVLNITYSLNSNIQLILYTQNIQISNTQRVKLRCLDTLIETEFVSTRS